MIKRTITGIFIILITTGFFFLREINPAGVSINGERLGLYLFDIFIVAMAIIGTFELVRALKMSMAQKILAITLPVVFFPLFVFLKSRIALTVAIIFILGELSLFVLDRENSTLEGMGYCVFVALYPNALFIPMILANHLPNNSLIVLILMFIISPVSDTMAYVVGSIVKGKKMCPNISPNKTISGGIGGLVGGVLASVILYFIMRNQFVYNWIIPEWLFFVLMGLLASIFTEFGDLVESVIKRKLGVKDLGKLLPGHGGVMDRVDGFIFACPFIYFIFMLL